MDASLLFAAFVSVHVSYVKFVQFLSLKIIQYVTLSSHFDNLFSLVQVHSASSSHFSESLHSNNPRKIDTVYSGYPNNQRHVMFFYL